ncbi:NADH-quinone oxidoreductase subunit K [Dehalobacter sp. DCM]|uniref:NADH-quinone oxidoreductase subunit K n=1 Tax=Dehalobacter sp. DCM TaxID=2907827 RepID=UPI003081B8A5|nr:NADH-quinone oxidoreductase subunit K [Dehalobacter sp. DCM]
MYSLMQFLIILFSLGLVLTSLLTIESRDLVKSSRAYLGQALLLVAILSVYAVALPNHELFLWSVTILVSKGIIVPWLLRRYGRKVDRAEVRPLIELWPSLLIALGLIVLFFWLTHSHYSFLIPSPDVAGEPYRTNLAVAATILCLGFYALLTRRDAVKAVIALCLMENGVHLGLMSLAPTIPETAMIGVATDVVISIWMLLYIITGIYAKNASTDTWDLSKLRG